MLISTAEYSNCSLFQAFSRRKFYKRSERAVAFKLVGPNVYCHDLDEHSTTSLELPRVYQIADRINSQAHPTKHVRI